MRRGLRQGDPLSPYLFILATDVFTKIIQKATTRGFLHQIDILDGTSGISSLQYADDTLLLLPPHLPSIQSLKIILYCFELLTGLRINFNKSCLYALGPATEFTQLAADILHCKVGSLPFTYLGLPIKASPLTRTEWQPLLDKVEKKLDPWQGPCLSRGGRLTLVNSVLTNTPLHFMSFFHLPQWIINKIDQIRRAFLWKGDKFIAGGHCLVNWNTVCTPKVNGGLGVARLRDFNIALLAKWWWKLFSNHNSPWVTLVMRNYYSRHRLWSLSVPRRTKLSPLWKSVLKSVAAFTLGIRFICGNGEHISFWHDHWILDKPLSMAFPCLYEIAADVNASVASQWYHTDTWVPVFNCLLSPQRLIALRQLLHLLQRQAINSQLDSFTWEIHRSGSFTTRSQYLALQPPLPLDEAASNIWSVRVPLKIAITMWLALLDHLPTGAFLHHRNITPDLCCVFCGVHSETTTHILLHCCFIREAWLPFQLRFQLRSWPSDIRSLWTTWRNSCINPINFRSWDTTVMAMISSIWFERNNHIFNSRRASTSSISKRADHLTQLWLSYL